MGDGPLAWVRRGYFIAFGISVFDGAVQIAKWLLKAFGVWPFA